MYQLWYLVSAPSDVVRDTSDSNVTIPRSTLAQALVLVGANGVRQAGFVLERTRNRKVSVLLVTNHFLVTSGDSAGQTTVDVPELAVASQTHFPLVQVQSPLTFEIPPGKMESLM